MGRRLIAAIVALVLGHVLVGIVLAPASAATSPVIVSLTFDDGTADQYAMRSVLASHGMKATFYVMSAELGTSSTYLTWSQIHGLADDGNEIGGHTLHHPDLPEISDAEARTEICDDRAAFVAQGLYPVSFAYPYGSFNTSVEAIVPSCGYSTARMADGIGPSGPFAESMPPLDMFATRSTDLTGLTLQQMQQFVTRAENNGGGWVVVLFHQICDDCGTYSTTLDTMTAFLDWLQPRAASGTVVRTVAEALGLADPPQAPVNTGLPTVSGTAQQGQTLTASTGSWSNSPSSYAYQWLRCNTSGASCGSITNATSSSYLVAAADVGFTLRARVTATNSGDSTSADSVQTAVVAAAVLAPVNTGLPTVSGTAQQGQTLTASTGSWSNSPSSYAYQWLRCNTSGASCGSITNATSSSYLVAAADVGFTLRARVTATNSGDSTSADSVQTAVVAAAVLAPVNTGLPTVSGTAQQGQTLTASTGSWSNSPSSYAYQWQGGIAIDDGLPIADGFNRSNGGLGGAWTAGGEAGAMQISANAAMSSLANGSWASSYWNAGQFSDQYAAFTLGGTFSANSVELKFHALNAGRSAAPGTNSWSGYGLLLRAGVFVLLQKWTGASTTTLYQTTVAANVPLVGDRYAVRVFNGSAGASTTIEVWRRRSGTWTMMTSSTDTTSPYLSGYTAISTSNAAVSLDDFAVADEWAPISAATASTYTLTAGEVGKQVRAQVIASNTAGASAPATSNSVGPVQAALAPVNTGLPTVSGTAQQGQTLTASTGSWSNSPSSYAYQWLRCNTSGASCGSITNATSSSYLVAAADVGFTLRARVTATNSGDSTSADSVQTAVVAAAVLAPVNTGLPTVSGTAQQGQTLTASTGSWSNSPSSYAYQWLRCNTSGASCGSITNATSSSYLVAAADVGFTLRARVTATNSGDSTSADSVQTAVVAAAVLAPVNTGLPTVSGTAQQGQTLTASTGSWSNSPSSYAYQWLRCNTSGASCGSITNATSSSYLVAAADVGFTLRARVTATNSGDSTSADSVQTAVVAAAVLAPVNTGLPTVSGTAQQGQTLTASTGSWSNSPSSYAYQWLRCNTSGASCGSITNATSSSYLVAAADVGFTLRARVTATNSGDSTSADSVQTAVVAAAVLAPVNTGLPTVSGTAQQGQTLTASTGSWSNSPSSYAYQWLRCNTSGASCGSISGATSSTYKARPADVGFTLRATVTASNSGGSTSADSAPTETILPRK